MLAAGGDRVYVPSEFRAHDREAVQALVRAHGFATLVTIAEGLPFASHLPLLLDAGRGPEGTLLGHVARANPQWRHFGKAPALAIFAGPHGYVSPSWYATAPAVPTWNYVAVHASGVPRIVDDDAAVQAILARLVATHEAALPAPRPLDLPPDFAARMRRGIVAFEMPIDRLEGKLKLSQNRSPADQSGVVAGLRAAGNDALADLMVRG
jgi:transcriptional regulator